MIFSNFDGPRKCHTNKVRERQILYDITYMKNLKSNTNEKCKSLSHIWLFATPWTISSVQSLSCVRLFVTPWIAARQASLSITNSRSSLKLMSIELVRPSSHFILCRPLLLLPPILPSIRVFFNESTLCIRWPRYWSFTFNISPSNEHPGLISFRMDWLDLLEVQGTLKSLLQHHSSKVNTSALSFLHSPILTSIHVLLNVKC